VPKPFDPTLYLGDALLQERIAALPGSNRAIAKILPCAPGTLASKLRGDTALYPEERARIKEVLEQLESEGMNPRREG
jgi:hypothetical protein